VDEDTRAFDRILAAMQMPKGSSEEQQTRSAAITEATKGAILVPLETMRICVRSLDLLKAMSEKGLPASVSDAGVGALCARTGALGAYLNVRINCAGLDAPDFIAEVTREADLLRARAEEVGDAVFGTVLGKV